MAIALFLHIHCCEALHAIATTLLYVQTADKWLATTFISLNACACGGAELHTMAMVAIEDFQKLGKRAVVFSADHPACPEQKDGRTCGMCIIGFALTVILQLGMDCLQVQGIRHTSGPNCTRLYSWAMQLINLSLDNSYLAR